MHAFIVKKDITHKTEHYRRTYLETSPNANTPAEKVFIDCAGESEGIVAVFKAENENEDVVAEDIVKIIPESTLTAWKYFPPRIGRVSIKVFSESIQMHDEPNILPLQIENLKLKTPLKKHYRIAIVNAFGTNLGDCLLGMTALRIVEKVIKHYVESVVVDLFLGANSNKGNREIVGSEDFIGNVSCVSPSMKDFADYDAYFDFTGLIFLPRFNEMPIVDWLLWWMGLDPNQVEEEHKRNKLTIDWKNYQSAKIIFDRGCSYPSLNDKKVIYFNANSSVPLRSFPKVIISNFIRELLEHDPSWVIVCLTDVDLEHPRFINLSETKINTSEFVAFLSFFDGILTSHSFPYHVADVLSKPCVAICTSLPDLDPYYPLGKCVILPDAEKLDGWMKSKVDTDQWKAMELSYIEAWRKVNCSDIVKLLNNLIESGKDISPRLSICSDTKNSHAVYKKSKYGYALKYENTPTIWIIAKLTMINFMTKMAKYGSHCWVFSPGQNESIALLAKGIGRDGMLQIFEPRYFRQLSMAQYLALNFPQVPVTWHKSIPFNDKFITIVNEDPLSETSPLHWGNGGTSIDLEAIDINKLETSNIDCMFFFPPTPFFQTIGSLFKIIEKQNPIIMCAPVMSMAAVVELANILFKADYECWIDGIGDKEDVAFLFIGFPTPNNNKMTGFTKVTNSN